MQLTDTHTHLFAEEFDADRAEMMQRAIDKGVTSCFLPNIEVSTISAMLKMCDEFPANCYPMMGLHPCSVNANYEQQLAEIKTWFDKRKLYGIGETGIDLFHDITFAEEQKKALRIQIEWAKEMNLPIILHCRNSFNEVMEIITEMHDERLKGIFHCFGGTLEEAQRVMDLKTFKMGIGGVVTYKNSTLPQVLKEVPLSYIVLETDSPYLPPVPYRGKRNESSYIWQVADKLSEIYRLTIEKIAEITTQNARDVFGEF
ncbi:MAG TPA: TatD family hydrolase [Bacteroidia bacterium]|jgi:TatD DNase family protein|nr:TatD family hydrolase [Bacteroidia bacterium]